jgi:transcriptional regulator with PAS, ATPase and Fis domain
MHDWMKEFPGAITVCDADGIVVEMNDRAIETFENDGGRALIGRSLFDCHPGPSGTKLAALLAGKVRNAYTIEKRGVRKLIYQAPWYRDGTYAGFVELSVEIPPEMPHFVREA